MAKRATRSGRRAFLAGTGGIVAALVSTPGSTAAQRDAGSTSEVRDRALWITWYDLPEEGRSDHLTWVHQTYIPALLKRPGYLWTAHYTSKSEERGQRTDDRTVPNGSAYILVVGGEDVNVFGNPTPDELHETLFEDSKQMLSMRRGERTNIFAEASRVTGPAAKEYKDGMTLAPCIQLGSFNIDYRKEVDLLAWYAQSTMPVMAETPGCIRTRRLASVSGWAKLGILYEYGSLELRNKSPQGGAGGGRPNKWQASVSQVVHAPGSPNVATRIWPAVEG